jgi:hypothetical protein
MFHWICPECGREIPPAVKECPTCDPQAAQLVAPPVAALPAISDRPDPLLNLAQKLRDAQREVQATQELQAASIEAPAESEPIQASPPAASEPEPASVTAPAPALPQFSPQPAMLLLAAPPSAVALLAPIETPAAIETFAAIEAPAAIETPATVETPATIKTPAAGETPAPVEAVEPAQALAPVVEPEPEEPAVETPIELPELAERPAVTELSSPAPEPEPEPEPADPATAGRVATPEPALSALAPTPKPLEEPAALPAATAIPRSVKSVSAPASPALGLAPLQDSSSIGNRIRPASPPVRIMRPDPGPRITLPGPALPPALNSLEDAGLSKILVDGPKREKTGSRGWFTGMLVATVLLATFVSMDLYNAPRSAASATPAPVAKDAAAAVSAPAPSETSASSASYPLSKAVEVTGFRFIGDKKPEVHYLVVNHSAAELSGVTVYVALRASPGKPPLYHFSFRSPTLGPYESKEMVASIDKPLQSATDWQSLHADVEVGQ